LASVKSHYHHSANLLSTPERLSIALYIVYKYLYGSINPF